MSNWTIGDRSETVLRHQRRGLLRPRGRFSPRSHWRRVRDKLDLFKPTRTASYAIAPDFSCMIDARRFQLRWENTLSKLSTDVNHIVDSPLPDG